MQPETAESQLMQLSLTQKKSTRQLEQETVLFPWRQVSQLGLACWQVIQFSLVKKKPTRHV